MKQLKIKKAVTLPGGNPLSGISKMVDIVYCSFVFYLNYMNLKILLLLRTESVNHDTCSNHGNDGSYP